MVFGQGPRSRAQTRASAHPRHAGLGCGNIAQPLPAAAPRVLRQERLFSPMPRLTPQCVASASSVPARDAEESVLDPLADRYTEGAAPTTPQPSGCARSEVSELYEIALRTASLAPSYLGFRVACHRLRRHSGRIGCDRHSLGEGKCNKL